MNGRNSDNTLIKELLNWAPSQPLVEGMNKTYNWIAEQIRETLPDLPPGTETIKRGRR